MIKIKALQNAASRSNLITKLIAFGTVRGTLSYDKTVVFMEYKGRVYELKQGESVHDWSVAEFDKLVESGGLAFTPSKLISSSVTNRTTKVRPSKKIISMREYNETLTQYFG